MPKLPVLSPKKLIKILENSGFQIDHKTGSHFIYYNFQNKKRAVVPYHAKDLPKGTLLSILKQVGILKEDLKNI